MAGKKLGNIYVEMGLDSKEFTKGEAKILQSAQSTSLLMEQNWRTLGGHSDQIYNAMRTNAQNAMDAIANKSTSTNAEIVRAQQAASDKIKSINEQQFGHQTTTMEKIKANWISMTLAVAAAMVVMNKAAQFIELGAKAAQAEESFRRVAQSAGESADKIITNMKRATVGTVDDSDLMQRAVKGMMLGLSGDAMVKIAAMARLGARVAGTSVADALEGITNSIATGMPRALKQYGLALGPEVKIITAAQTAGVEGINLMTLAQMNFDIQLAKHGAIQANAIEQTQIFKAQITEVKEQLGGALIALLRQDYGLLQMLGSGFLYAAGATNYLVAGLAGVAAWTADKLGFTEKAKAMKTYADFASATAKQLMADADAMKNRGMANVTGNAEKGKGGPTADAQARVAELEKEKAAFLKDVKDRTAAVKGAAKDAQNILAGQLSDIKGHYDAAIALDNQWYQEQKDNRYNAVNIAKEYYDKKNADLYTSYSQEWDAISKSKVLESEKYKQLEAINKTYTDTLGKNQTELTVNLRKAFSDNAADAKKTYDEQAAGAKEYKKLMADELAFSVDKHTAAMLKINENEDLKLAHAEENMDIGKMSWDEYQAYLVEVQKNTALAITDLFQKEAKDQADYYSSIEGYAQTAYDKKLKLIELERQANILLYKDVGAANAKANQDIQKALSDRIDAEQKGAKSVITGFGDMLDAAMTMYDKDSSEYKRLADAKKIIQIAELAMNVAKNAQIIASNLGLITSNTAVTMSNAGAAVTGASIGVGPTGFATAAAMIALLAGVFAMYGIAASGGSASVSAPALPKSTVLGAEAGVGSESIANSMKLMEDTYKMEDTKLTSIYNALRDLSTNIIGLVTSIFRMGGINTQGYESSMMPGSELQQTAMKNTLTSAFDAIFISMGDWISLIFGSNTLVNNFMNAIFGSVDTEFQSGGIEIGATIVKSIIDGASISAQQYAKIKTSTTGPLWGLFGGNSESTGIQYSPLDQRVNDMLTLVFSNLGDTLVELAKGLGTDVQKVYDYVFSTTQIDLNGMDAEKMSKALNDYFSSIADKAAEDLFGTIIQQYQKLNEALLETAVRLVNDKAIVEGVLKMTGQAFVAVSDTIFYNLTEAWKNWAATGAYGIEPPKYELIQTATEKTIAFSEALIELAGGLDKLTEAASTFFDKFYSDVEKQAYLQSNLTSVLALQNETLPATRDGYRALVEGLDLTTTSGQEAYVTLLKLSESADAYYSYLEEVASKKSDLEIQIMKLTGDTAGALAAQREIELAALDESLRPLQLRIYALQDEAQAITDLTTAVTNLKTRAQQIAQFITDMGMSAQAPVQSAAAWDTEYARQRKLAMASGATDQQISDYLAFAKQYLSYEQSYGTAGSYQEIYDAIMKDVTGLGTATNTALDIAQKQLDVLIQIRDGSGIRASYASGTDYVPETGLYQLHRGEIVSTKSDSVKKLGAAIGDYIMNSNGGSNGGDVTVQANFILDGKVVQTVVAKGMRTNSDLIQSTRKAVN